MFTWLLQPRIRLIANEFDQPSHGSHDTLQLICLLACDDRSILVLPSLADDHGKRLLMLSSATWPICHKMWAVSDHRRALASVLRSQTAILTRKQPFGTNMSTRTL